MCVLFEISRQTPHEAEASQVSAAVPSLRLPSEVVSVSLAPPPLQESFQMSASDDILSALRVQARLQRLKSAVLKIDFASLGWFAEAAVLYPCKQLTLVCVFCISSWLMRLKVEPPL